MGVDWWGAVDSHKINRAEAAIGVGVWTSSFGGMGVRATVCLLFAHFEPCVENPTPPHVLLFQRS